MYSFFEKLCALILWGSHGIIRINRLQKLSEVDNLIYTRSKIHPWIGHTFESLTQHWAGSRVETVKENLEGRT